jgi:hypothetical protein
VRAETGAVNEWVDWVQDNRLGALRIPFDRRPWLVPLRLWVALSFELAGVVRERRPTLELLEETLDELRHPSRLTLTRTWGRRSGVWTSHTILRYRALVAGNSIKLKPIARRNSRSARTNHFCIFGSKSATHLQRPLHTCLHNLA